jgi:hypothetical protein
MAASIKKMLARSEIRSPGRRGGFEAWLCWEALDDLATFISSPDIMRRANEESTRKSQFERRPCQDKKSGLIWFD